MDGIEYRKLSKIITKSISAVVASQGLVKTHQALAALDSKFRYDLASKPASLPQGPAGVDGAPTPASNKQLLLFFGVPQGWSVAHNTTDHSLLAAITVQWNAHCTAWLAPALDKPPASPGDIFDYWKSLEHGARELSELARHNWSSPVSNTAPERVFRILTHMDDPTRRTMEHISVFNQLYLRVNGSIVKQLGSELATDIAATKQLVTARSAEASAGKRKRDAAALSATTAGMLELRSGKSLRKARRKWKREAAMSDGDDTDAEIELLLTAINDEAERGASDSRGAAAAGAPAASTNGDATGTASASALGEAELDG